MSDRTNNSLSGKLSQFVLGTAQLGLPRYGVANVSGRPDEGSCAEIQQAAIEAGVGAIDTARSYGDAESRIGRAIGPFSREIPIITKLSANEVSMLPAVDAEKMTEQSVAASLEALGVERLHTLLLHRWQQRSACGGAVWDRLKDLRTRGLVGRLGVSVHTPDEALQALADPDVQHLQMPFNILDWRWKKAGVLDTLKARGGVTVHTRSTYLQGLMFLPPEKWPVLSASLAKRTAEILAAAVDEFSRASLADLALAGVRAMPWSDGIVISLETLEQFRLNAALFRNPPLDWSAAVDLASRFENLPENLLSPSQWTARS